MASVRAKRPLAVVASWRAVARRGGRSCRRKAARTDPILSPGDAVIETLKKRREFLAVRGGIRVSRKAFLIEAKAARTVEAGEPRQRFGFTVTKKLGNAVRRNLIRRRLKHAVDLACQSSRHPLLDYVIVARNAAADMPFAALLDDLTSALDEIARRHQRRAQVVIPAKQQRNGRTGGAA
jgi:ribonuclease P protein component